MKSIFREVSNHNLTLMIFVLSYPFFVYGGKGYLRDWSKDLLFFLETWCRTAPFFYHPVGKVYGGPLPTFPCFIDITSFLYTYTVYIDYLCKNETGQHNNLKRAEKSFSAAFGVMIRGNRRLGPRAGRVTRQTVGLSRPIQILLGNFSATFRILSKYFVRVQLLATFWKTSTFLVTFRLFNLFWTKKSPGKEFGAADCV